MVGKLIQATKLTSLQLKTLDIGAPVIVTCKTLSGEKIAIRLQTSNLDPETDAPDHSSRKYGGWMAHGAYVAVMPNGGEE